MIWITDHLVLIFLRNSILLIFQCMEMNRWLSFHLLYIPQSLSLEQGRRQSKSLGGANELRGDRSPSRARISTLKMTEKLILITLMHENTPNLSFIEIFRRVLPLAPIWRRPWFGSILSWIRILASNIPIRQHHWFTVNFTILEEQEVFFIWHLWEEVNVQITHLLV